MDLLIRPVQARDLQSLNQGLNLVIQEQRYLGSAEEISLASHREFLDNILTKQYPQIVAEFAGKIVGCCDVLPYPELGFRHVGRCGMWVLPDFRGQGIGRKLITDCLERANVFGLEKVELQVYGDNAPAIALYLSLGFEIEGRRKRTRKLDGVYQDVLEMGLFFGE